MPNRNPARVRPRKVRWFDGLFGATRQVLRRWDPNRGYDISSSVANEVDDVDLSIAGTLTQKPGRAQAAAGEAFSSDIDSIFAMNFTGERRAGLIVGNDLRIMELAEL